jgi:phosphoenolpyruvate synthase/pyruvate phosphate dikinase
MGTQTAIDEKGRSVPALTPSTVQTITVAETSAAISSAVGSGTRVVRLISSTDCHYVVAASPTAAATDSFLPANTIEYIKVKEGSSKVAAIQNAAGGTMYVTEMI